MAVDVVRRLLSRGSWRAGSVAGLVLALSGQLPAATPTVEEALKLTPVQADVEYDQPTAAEAARCKLKAEESGGHTGWVVRDSAGQVLRRFTDTDKDNVVDQWSYYLDGLEVYRDIDSNFNGKADQCRWLNSGGSRWGLDPDEDRKIDSWKFISAEEVTAEVIAALAQRDVARYARVLMTQQELKSAGIAGAKADDLGAKIEAAPTAFKALAGKQKSITGKTNWVHFGGTRPGLVPAGAEGATKDLLVYENVVAMVETEGKHGQVQIGTLIQVGDTWRVVDVPTPLDENQAELTAGGHFFLVSRNRPDVDAGGVGGSGDPKLQELLAKLEKLDTAANNASATPKAQQKAIADRTDVIEQIAAAADDPEDRALWIRQLADTVSAAAQTGTYPEGVARLKTLHEKLAAEEGGKELAAYVKFRFLTADYGLSLQEEKDFAKVQAQWLDDLRKFVLDYPDTQDAAEAMLQLGMAEEFAGQEDEAKKWYGEIVSKFPKTPSAAKAGGAKTRLESVGKVIQFQGAGANGKSVDLAHFRKKVVVIQYWATWCEPCKADMAQLRELQAKYGKDGFAIIGVNLDSKKEDLLGFLKKNPLPWTHVYEPGGLDSRLANELGVLTLPTMLLLDQQGKVVNRSIHVTELDREVKSLLR